MANNGPHIAIDSAAAPPYGAVSWERMIRAVEEVRERLRRATAALEAAGVPYAVAGGNAVAAWVSRVDEAAVRNCPLADGALTTRFTWGKIAVSLWWTL
jgi:hypothetical protein